MEDTRVKAPRKSTRRKRVQRLEAGALGRCKEKVTAAIAMTVAGTWIKNDLCGC